MFAVIRTGGKQYRVSKDVVIAVEKLDSVPGEIVNFNDVLMIGATIGTPIVSGASVVGEILYHFKDEKIIVFKKQRRKNYRRKKGHRQNLTLVRIVELVEHFR